VATTADPLDDGGLRASALFRKTGRGRSACLAMDVHPLGVAPFAR
jgi:hypothetical protein